MFTWLIQHSPLFYFTQSLWRDEAFSILVAEKPLGFFLKGIGFEPPLYYLLLHYWIKIFGESEIATRSLSLLAFLLATWIVGVWAEKLFKKSWLAWFLPLFFFLNPMLLYYAFEIRTYGWFIFFTVASLYTYCEKNWPWYVAATVLGFYNHTYLIFVPLVQFIHWIVTKFRGKFKKVFADPFVRSLIVIGLCMSPWLIKFLLNLSLLRQSWYFPADWQLVTAVLGNMFLGYEGTPWYLWQWTKWLSLILLGFSCLALLRPQTRPRNLFFFLLVFVPLALVIGISFKKPLFVNRYLIFVTVAEVFLMVFALEAIKNRFLQILTATACLLPIVCFNFWYPPQHAKLDIRATLTQINILKGPQDLIYADSPLIFFETVYYSRNRTQVFLYNPAGSTFPWYVGDIIFAPHQMVRELPVYPRRAFMVHENGNFEMVYQASKPQKL